MFTEDKNHKDRKKVQEDTDSLDNWSRIWQIQKIYVWWRYKIFIMDKNDEDRKKLE